MVSGAAILDGSDPAGAIRGAVERLDAHSGIEGWAVDLARPAAPLDVELWAGGRRLAMCRTGLIRQHAAAGANEASGFAFGADALDSLRRAAADGARGPVEVRISGYATPLALETTPLDLGFMALAGTVAAGGRDADFLARLARLRSEAARTLQQPLRPNPEQRVGFIEVAAIDEGGLVWVLGWMARDVRVDRPLVVLDGSKNPAGFAYMPVARDDLPPDATGLVGVLHGDWRPSRGSKAFFFLGDEGGRHLESLDPINLVSKATLVQHCAPLWERGGPGYGPELRRLMQQVRSWDVLPADFAPELAAVEELLVLPGFGCFVTGWTLSPTKQVERLALRLGNSVLVSDVGAMVTKRRPDLANIFPGADRLVEHAGFTAAFPGMVDPDMLGDAVLKVVYRDGTASNHAIGAAVMRRLGESVNWDRVRLLYPAIVSEPFFPAFAAAVRGQLQAAAQEVRPITVQPCTEAAVFAVPRDRSDVFLTFDGIARHAAGLAPGAGIVILAGRDEDRSALAVQIEGLRAVTDRPLSLLLVPDVAMAAYSLPEVARQTGIERFLFVAGSAVLAPAGWAAGAAFDDALSFVELVDPAREGATGEAGFDAFAWSVEAYRGWLAGEAPRFGGPGPAAPELAASARRVADGAFRTRLAALSPLHEAINQ